MLEAQRVADLVGHHVADQLAHQLVGERQLLRVRIVGPGLHEVPVLPEVLNVVVELHVRFEDFAAARIVHVRADRVLGRRRQPPDHGVTHVFAAPVRIA